MPTSFGEPLTKLRAVPIEENGDPLVDACEFSPRVHLAQVHPKFPKMQRVCKLRRTVARMLAEAAERLPDGVDIEVIEGFRPLAQQRFMYESLKREMADKHPRWSKPTLYRMVNQLSAPPDDPSPPPHTTGAAVDLCLIRADMGERLDMTSPFDWDEKSAPTAMKGLSETAQANRGLLIETLSSVDLTNYAGEWWHWSWGDQGWALRTGAQKAFYDRVPEGERGQA